MWSVSLQHNADYVVAKELMEHSDISVTAKIYTHMVDEVFEQNRKRLAEYATFKEQRKENA